METAVILEVAAHGVTAVLAAWLGLTVATRSPTPPGRIFAAVAIAVAVWSSSVIVQRLTTLESALLVARRLEELAVIVALPAVGHLSLVIAADGHPSRRARLVVAALYALNFAVTAPTLVDPTFSPQLLAGRGVGEAVFAWTWVVARLAPLALGVAWLLRAMRGAESFRRRQLTVAVATVVAAGAGAALRVLPGVSESEAWIGVSMITVAIVLAAYAVFAAGIFFGPAVAGRAFRTSILGGLALVVLVLAIVALDTLGRAVTGLNVPLLPLLALVVAIAVYEPVAARLRPVLAGEGSGTARERLLRALGQTDLVVRPADAGVGPALRRLAAALDVDGLAVVRPDGTRVAVEGVEPSGTAMRPVPLVAGARTIGELRVGRPASGLPLTARDEELIRLSAAYVSAALETGVREDEQAASLDVLVAERAMVEARAADLHEALVEHADTPPGLRVHALGPLRVERDGVPVDRWGGDKAGSRQALALFAFLFDRGERGVAKEEALEMIWPDADLGRADLAFHRTMVGLRGTLQPGSRGRSGRGIRFVNDRYRLEPGVVAWSDVDAFLAELDAAAQQGDAAARQAALERARSLYRGDYLDDCPFYGDSVYVEEQRARLRARWTDLMLALGETYEQLGDRSKAAAAFREAAASPDGCPPAVAALERLGRSSVARQNA